MNEPDLLSVECWWMRSLIRCLIETAGRRVGNCSAHGIKSCGYILQAQKHCSTFKNADEVYHNALTQWVTHVEIVLTKQGQQTLLNKIWLGAARPLTVERVMTLLLQLRARAEARILLIGPSGGRLSASSPSHLLWAQDRGAIQGDWRLV